MTLSPPRGSVVQPAHGRRAAARVFSKGLLALSFALSLAVAPAHAENIDPLAEGARYAWGENIGWVDAQPLGPGGSGMQIGDLAVSGWLWAENVGWISLSCTNTSSCATVEYGVVNDGFGRLSGFAWGENIGWIDFAPTGAGVVVDAATRRLTGYAWAENVGWINFGGNGTFWAGVRTGWCLTPPAVPGPVGTLAVGRASGDAVGFNWTAVSGAYGYDIVRGDLAILRTPGKGFGDAVQACAASRAGVPPSPFPPTLSPTVDVPVAPGSAVFFLIRGANCGGAGSYDEAGAAARDAAIAASGVACP